MRYIAVVILHEHRDEEPVCERFSFADVHERDVFAGIAERATEVAAVEVSNEPS